MENQVTNTTARGVNPRCVWITVNRNCNFRCNGCYANGTGYDPAKDMPFDLAKNIVDLVDDMGVKNITIIGGEPTLWRHLLDFNKLCNSKGLKTTVVTNATRFGVDSFWNRYIDTPNSKAGISVKAFDKESMQKLAGVDSHNLTQKGLRRAIKHFRCGVSTVYSATSANTFLDLARFTMDCGAKSISISTCTPAFSNGIADGTYVADPGSTVKHLVDIYPELVKITGGRVVFSMKLPLCLWPVSFIETLIDNNQIRSVCQLQYRTGLIFDVDGKIASCNSLFDYPIGEYGIDFTDNKSLVSLINSQRTIDMYDKLTSYPSKKCIECPAYDICAGGCPLYWALFDPKKIIPGFIGTRLASSRKVRQVN